MNRPSCKITQIALVLFVSCASCLALAAPNSSGTEAAPAAPSQAAALQMLSNEDEQLMQEIKHHISSDYSDFKSVGEVHSFLDKVKLLVQKHPKNIAFAQGEMREMFKFLSQESVGKLIRLDAEPFAMLVSDDRIAMALRASDNDELARKLFAGPLRSLVEQRRQQVSRTDSGSHKETNFLSSIWCKLSGGCSN